MFSSTGPVDCLWSGYGGWSRCSVTCGEGKQQRKRKILQPARNGGRRCTGNGIETRPCNSQIACPGKRLRGNSSSPISAKSKLCSLKWFIVIFLFQLIVSGIALEHGQNVVPPVAKAFKEGEGIFVKELKMEGLVAREVKLNLGSVTMVLVRVSIDHALRSTKIIALYLDTS